MRRDALRCAAIYAEMCLDDAEMAPRCAEMRRDAPLAVPGAEVRGALPHRPRRDLGHPSTCQADGASIRLEVAS